MTHVLQVTPLLHFPNLAQALDLFVRVLGFEVKFRMNDYAYLERENAGMRILEECERPAPEQRRMTVYMDVRDVDALYAELLPELRTLPGGDVQAPMNMPWGQREFHVKLPDGDWLAFGMPAPAGSAQHSEN